MGKVSRIILFFGLLLGAVPLASADNLAPRPVDLIPQNLFTPPGFDNNDNAQVVLQGNYISTCFRAGNPTSQVDLARKRIVIRSQTLYSPSSWCLRVLVPYLQPVDVGVLPPGKYTVDVMDSQGRAHSMGILPVAASRAPRADDYLYAPATDAFFESGDVIRLAGTFTDNCSRIAEVKTLVRSRNIIELLPVVERAQRPCATVMVPFETRVKMDHPWKGITLIHVRTMNGHALNRVVEF